ncbi:hypothetical protein Tco_0444773 [Tanacetum coccineum]
MSSSILPTSGIPISITFEQTAQNMWYVILNILASVTREGLFISRSRINVRNIEILRLIPCEMSRGENCHEKAQHTHLGTPLDLTWDWYKEFNLYFMNSLISLPNCFKMLILHNIENSRPYDFPHFEQVCKAILAHPRIERCLTSKKCPKLAKANLRHFPKRDTLNFLRKHSIDFISPLGLQSFHAHWLRRYG